MLLAMGYLISAHIVRTKPKAGGLSSLPPSIGHRVYYHRSAKVYIIDAFRSARPPAYPFQSTVPAADIPLELPPELSSLEKVYGYLNKHKLANSFKKSYINFSLLLARSLKQRVLSFVSDDDGLDFACIAADGLLEKLRCRAEDLEISFANGATRIQPLQPEMDGEQDILTDLNNLRAALPEISVSDRTTPWDQQLHAIALQEVQAFTGINAPILGLGSFDPPEDEKDWELISS